MTLMFLKLVGAFTLLFHGSLSYLDTIMDFVQGCVGLDVEMMNR